MAGPVSLGMGGAWQGIWAEPHEGHYVPRTQPRMVHMAWGQRHSAQGSRHARSKLGPLGPPPCALEATASPAIHPSRASRSGSQARGGYGCFRAWPACLGQSGPRLNGALCGQQSHLSPPPAPLPSWGHSVAFIPAWPKVLSWEGVSQ